MEAGRVSMTDIADMDVPEASPLPEIWQLTMADLRAALRAGIADFRRAPQPHYLLRVIDPPARDDLPPRCSVIAARGPFAPADEIALMRERRIDIVVTKNSGGVSTYAKIVAARALGLPVAMIARPPQGDALIVHNADAVMRFLAS